MTERQRYTAPPITEAVVQLSFSDPLGNAQIEKLSKRLAKHYVHETRQNQVSVRFDLRAQTSEFDQVPQHRLSSSDEADLLLIRQDSLAWSRLAPYEGWEAFFSRVKRDFNIAHSVVGIKKMSRIGVRYINRIDVPMNENEARFEEYFSIRIEVPEKIDTISGYVWRFEYHEPTVPAVVVVQSATANPVIPNTSAFILDVDIVCTESIPIKSEELFAAIERMRVLKNQVFELSITDKARRTFNHELHN